MNSPKIAIYSGEIPSTTFIERLIEGLAQSEVKVYLFGAIKKDTKYPSDISVIGYQNRFQKAFQLLYYEVMLRLFFLQDKKKLDEVLKNENRFTPNHKIKYYPVLYHRPDIFHLQWAKGIGDWMWVQKFGIKLILSLRGTHITISPHGNDYWKNLYEETFPKLDGFHAVSHSISAVAQDYGAKSAAIQIVYSGLNVQDMPFSEKKVKSKSLKILSIGRSHWVKGYHYALDAMSLLKKGNMPFEYTIIGVQNDEELLIQRAQLALGSEVDFIDQLPFQEIVNAIQLADVVLLASVEEGIANVVLEAMALGTLVISTDCGGMNEVIRDGENGFLIPIRNPGVMAAVLQKAAHLSITDYRKMTLNARNIIENQHSFAKMISDMNQLYKTVLNESL